MTRVAVVGAGVLGSSLAFRLARAGADVRLFDAGMPGAGASGASFAWANARSKRPRPYFDLNLAGMEAHRRLAAELGDADWWVPSGGLQWVETPEATAEAEFERLREWGYRFERLDRRAAAELEPGLWLGDQERFALYPEEGFVYGRLLIGRLLSEAHRLGLGLSTGTPVTSLESRAGRVCGVRTAGGDLVPADLVAICAGAWANRLLEPYGLQPLVAIGERGISGSGNEAGTLGLLAVTEPAPASIRRVVHAPGLHFRPDGGGRLLLGDTELESTITSETATWPPPPEALELLRRGRRLLPALEFAGLEAVRIGVRPLPVDVMPVIGWVPGAEGVYVIATHSGITMAPLLGELAAAEMLEGSSASLLASFRPDRLTRVTLGTTSRNPVVPSGGVTT